MNLKELQKILVRMPATPMPSSQTKERAVRGAFNGIKNDATPKQEYDDFFDYDDDLVEMTSAREMARKAYNSESFFENTQKDDSNNKSKDKGMFFMEEIVSTSSPSSATITMVPITIIENSESLEADKLTSKNAQKEKCSYIKRNNKQCKNYSKPAHDMCSLHMELIRKKNSE